MLLSSPVVSLTFAVGNSIQYNRSVITEWKLLYCEFTSPSNSLSSEAVEGSSTQPLLFEDALLIVGILY
ncbi:MAG TPA: hypothetical protein VL095_15750 [Flavisolibacter sp.]|nr:hypothetical protein [Flavisolibacter sp.]